MFDLKAFIVTNIVNGIKNGTFTKEYGNIMAVNYYTKGIIGEEEIISVDTLITEWEEEQLNAELPEEDFVDEPVEEESEEDFVDEDFIEEEITEEPLEE